MLSQFGHRRHCSRFWLPALAALMFRRARRHGHGSTLPGAERTDRRTGALLRGSWNLLLCVGTGRPGIPGSLDRRLAIRGGADRVRPDADSWRKKRSALIRHEHLRCALSQSPSLPFVPASGGPGGVADSSRTAMAGGGFSSRHRQNPGLADFSARQAERPQTGRNRVAAGDCVWSDAGGCVSESVAVIRGGRSSNEQIVIGNWQNPDWPPEGHHKA